MTDIARLEAVEMDAWEDIYAACPAGLAQQLGLSTRRYGQALFMTSKALDNGQFCNLQGIGLAGDEDGASIEASVAAFRADGTRNFLIQIPPGPKASVFTERVKGLRLVPFRRAWTKFERGAAPAPRPATALTIVRAGAVQAADFGATAVGGFGMPPFLAPWLGALASLPNWRCYVSYDGSKPVGVGAMRIDGDAAWLGVGATLAEARGKGGQSGILARRIAEGLAEGVKLFVTETGTAVPGEPQTSFQNILKSGFEIAYDRPNWTEPD